MFKIFSTYICWINVYNVTLEVKGAVRPLYESLGVKGLRRVHSLFQGDFSTECDLGHPVAACVFFFVFPSLSSFPLSPINNAFYKAVPTQDVTNPASLSSILLSVRYSSPPWLFVILHISHDRSNWSSSSFSSTTFPNFPAISDLLSEMSQVPAPYKSCAPIGALHWFLP